MWTVIEVIFAVYLFNGFISVVFSREFAKTILSIFGFVVFIAILPAMPFMVAYNNRKTKPLQAWILVILYTILYLLRTLICVVYCKGH